MLRGVQQTGAQRAGPALLAAVLALAGVLVTQAGGAGPAASAGGAPEPTPVPANATRCADAGPYRPPEPDGVGLPPGVDLCPAGPIVVRTPGAVLDGWDVRGGIVVDAADVVVRRSRVTGDGSAAYGIWTTPAGSVRIEDTTVTGAFRAAAIGTDRWTAERIEVTRVTGDGAHLGTRAILRNSTLHAFTPPVGGPPVTALRLIGPRGGALVEGNRVDVGTGPGRHAAVLVAPPGAGSEREVVIRDNVLGGGEYTVAQDVAAADGGGVRIVDNRFGRDAGRAPLRVAVGALLDGNTFVDGGAVTGR